MKTTHAKLKKSIFLSILFAAPLSFSLLITTSALAKESYLQKVSNQPPSHTPKRYCSQGNICGKICVSERYVCSAHPVPKAWPKPKAYTRTKVARN